jgi:hypothetical protein
MDNTAISSRFAQLPKELKYAIKEVKTLPVIEEIAKEHKLHLDVTENLRREVVLVLFGETGANEFPARLEAILPLPESAVEEVVKKLDQEVFEKVRGALRRISEGEAVSSEASSGNGETAAPSANGPVGASKLGQTVHSTAQTLEITVPQNTQKPVDPYREPVE